MRSSIPEINSKWAKLDEGKVSGVGWRYDYCSSAAHETEASCAPEYQKSILNGPSWMRGRCLAWAGDMIIVARHRMKLKIHALPNTIIISIRSVGWRCDYSSSAAHETEASCAAEYNNHFYPWQ